MQLQKAFSSVIALLLTVGCITGRNNMGEPYELRQNLPPNKFENVTFIPVILLFFLVVLLAVFSSPLRQLLF